MKKHLLTYVAAVAMVITVGGVQAQANHLVLSEIGLNPAVQPNDMSPEFVEIYNPTAYPILLDNYYLTDNNYYSLMPMLPDNKVNGATTDHLLAFPSGTILESGQVAVVTGGATTFLEQFFGSDKANFDALPGQPLLFEVGPTSLDVPDMITYNNSATRPVNFSLTNAGTNSGEFSVLFYWDGKSQLVQDVDIVAWGAFTEASTNAFVAKTAPYAADANGHVGMSAVTANGDVLVRTSTLETGEVLTGGNGLAGHDETTENFAANWVAYGGKNTNMTPGTTLLTTSSANTAPTVNTLERDKQYPVLSDTVTLNANVTDVDGSVQSVQFYVDLGTGYSAMPATKSGDNYSVQIGPFTEKKLVRYYVVATDDGGLSVTKPHTGINGAKSFRIDNQLPVDGDIVINELLSDVIGTDNYEWIELYNNLPTTVSLAGYRVTDKQFEKIFSFPDDATIAGNGFVLLSFNIPRLNNDFPDIPQGTPIYKYDFGQDNPSDTLALIAPNDLLYNGVTTLLDQVTNNRVAPWPEINSNVTGQSIELKNPTLDNSDGANWAAHPEVVVEGVYKNSGTPGRPNTPLSTVSDWTLY